MQQNISIIAEDGVFDVLIEALQLHVPTLFGVGGLIGNILTFATMNMKRKRRSPVAWNFKALALADTSKILFSLIPWLLLINAFSIIHPWGLFFCKFYFYAGYLTYGVSVWCVAQLTVDRVVAVCLPLHAAAWCTIEKARILLAVNIVVHAVMYFYYCWMEYVPQAGFAGDHYSVCVYPQSFPDWFPKFAQISFFIIDVICTALTTAIGNIVIFVKLRQEKQKWGHSESVAGRSVSTSAVSSQGVAQKDEDRGMLVMLLAVSLAFVLIQSVYYLDWLYWEVLRPDDAAKTPKLREFCFILSVNTSVVNYCINFYLYLLTSATFRRDLKQTIQDTVCCKQLGKNRK